ncbi:MAG: CDP-diacylglycerol--serine O-phosphatidyltransferase [Candidatus Scalindua sediminis]|nr:CDP-diacylglycerol--serine O-phosphatidyltransferase [Candidatus Scalindua sediminis]
MTKIKPYLPTIVSIGNLTCGFVAIIFIINKELSYAAWLIITAMVLDGLDGQIARLLKTKVAWGGHLDSFADMITFGLAPAFLIGGLDVFNAHIAIWFVCFFFTLCAVIRLAKFEAENNSDNARSKYFTGLPTTLAGGTVASLILLDSYLKTTVGIPIVSKSLPSIMFILSILMLSKVQYIKILDVLRKKHDLAHLLMIIGIFSTLLVLFILYPHIMLSLGFCVYIIIGNNHGIFRKRAIHTT